MLNAIDIGIITIFILAIIRGFMRGFILQIGGIISLILAYIGSKMFTPNVEELLHRAMELPQGVYHPLAACITFLTLYALLMIVVTLLHKLLHGLQLGAVNRVLGAIFGCLKYMIILSVVINIATMFNLEKRLLSEKTRAGSQFFSVVAGIAPTLLGIDTSSIEIELPEMDKLIPQGKEPNNSPRDIVI